MSYLLGILLGVSSVILILLVLIQQGRGGGLAGAFGGMGGQSAFGTKAGDLFTKITIFVAAFWILMCVATVKWATVETSPFGAGLGTQAGPAVVPGGADAKDDAKDSGKTPASTAPAGDKSGGDKNESPAEKD